MTGIFFSEKTILLFSLSLSVIVIINHEILNLGFYESKQSKCQISFIIFCTKKKKDFCGERRERNENNTKLFAKNHPKPELIAVTGSKSL